MNTEFKVKLTPKDDKAVYSQSLPMPIHLKEDRIVELALMHKYRIITVLPFSKYASPIFAQGKPNGKLRLLVDLRKNNSLIADDYTNNNHPVSTLSDAAQHCEPSRVFHGRIAYNVSDLKLGIRPQQQPIPTSQIAQEVLEQTEMIHQDVRKNTVQAYIKYKAYYDKKASASKLKEADYVYILQPKADHQGSKIPVTEFRWVGPYIIEKTLPNINYLVRKIGTDKTQVLHRMRMRQFTPRQPPADIAVKPQEYKSDPEVSLNHDDLYARAWECDYEQPFFDAENDNAVPPNLQEIPLQFDFSPEEMRNAPGNPHVCSPEIFPH